MLQGINSRIAHLGKLFCLLAVIGLLNLHIALYQTYAWATMLNDRIPEQGIEEAFTTTFDGAHPCERCKAVAQQNKKEEKKDPLPELKPGFKMPLIGSFYNRLRLSPFLGQRLPAPSLDHLPLVGISPPVIGPPPQFV